jgi:hypothetical protein
MEVQMSILLPRLRFTQIFGSLYGQSLLLVPKVLERFVEKILTPVPNLLDKSTQSLLTGYAILQNIFVMKEDKE